eukprot:TRINITY_DN64350_c0_g1_i1.p1 TRINITY_DN64350_c0_g1~~TRINITY_DN64350_c0_g1_i1.p1  ORF type:complete len:438 (+),score=100.05 TRINITY_DN64350_c0_g1_i1:75-1388(+)
MDPSAASAALSEPLNGQQRHGFGDNHDMGSGGAEVARGGISADGGRMTASVGSGGGGGGYRGNDATYGYGADTFGGSGGGTAYDSRVNEGGAPRRKWFSGVVGAIKKIGTIGDEIERRHFRGDFVGTMASVGSRLDESAARFVEGIGTSDSYTPGLEYGGSAAYIPHAEKARCGNDTGHVRQTCEAESNAFQTGATVSAIPVSALSTSGTGRTSSVFAGPVVACAAFPAETRPSISGSDGLWEESQQLQAELAQERERRRGRVSAMDAVDKNVRSLRVEVAEARRAVTEAEAEEITSKEAEGRSRRGAAEHWDIVHVLKGRKLHQEADIRRLMVEAAAYTAACARAQRECDAEGPRAWARPGPETDALKDAKLELAEALQALDESRHERRRELFALQTALEVEEAERERLIEESQVPESPANMLRATFSRIFAAATG